MSIWDSMKRMTQPYDDGYDDEYEDESADFEQGRRSRAAAPAETPVMEYSTPAAPAAATGFSGQIVSGSGRLRSEIRLFRPTAFEEASVAAKHLCDGKTVHLNVEETDATVARRVIDFLSGSVYALNGKVTKAGTGVYLFSPNNVEVTVEDLSSAEETKA